MASVDQRTELAGKNRFEMLLFFMGGGRRFGINVFKVREVIPAPRITRLPDSHGAVRGVSHIRGESITMIDLSQAIRGQPVAADAAASVIVTEYNRTTQGFLVEGVDRIQNVTWKDVIPPPASVANRAYLTAVTDVDSELVQIVDVEKVLVEAGGVAQHEAPAGNGDLVTATRNHILVVDDSLVARNQVQRTLVPDGWEVTVACNGQEALDLLTTWTNEPESPLNRTAVVISDIEMPRMDGYALTTAIRGNQRLKDLKVMLHTSLSGMFNAAMVQKVGADDFLAKFDANDLASKVRDLISQQTAA